MSEVEETCDRCEQRELQCSTSDYNISSEMLEKGINLLTVMDSDEKKKELRVAPKLTEDEVNYKLMILDDAVKILVDHALGGLTTEKVLKLKLLGF